MCDLKDTKEEWRLCGQSYTQKKDWYSTWFPASFFTKWATAFNIPAHSTAFRGLIFQCVQAHYRSNRYRKTGVTPRYSFSGQGQKKKPRMIDPVPAGSQAGSSSAARTNIPITIFPAFVPQNQAVAAPAANPNPQTPPSPPMAVFLTAELLKNLEEITMFSFEHESRTPLVIHIAQVCPIDEDPSLGNIDHLELGITIGDHFGIPNFFLRLQSAGHLGGTIVGPGASFENLTRYSLRHSPNDAVVFDVIPNNNHPLQGSVGHMPQEHMDFNFNIDPNFDPNIDPNFDPTNIEPNFDPNYDPNLDPNLAANIANYMGSYGGQVQSNVPQQSFNPFESYTTYNPGNTDTEMVNNPSFSQDAGASHTHQTRRSHSRQASSSHTHQTRSKGKSRN